MKAARKMSRIERLPGGLWPSGGLPLESGVRSAFMEYARRLTVLALVALAGAVVVIFVVALGYISASQIELRISLVIAGLVAIFLTQGIRIVHLRARRRISYRVQFDAPIGTRPDIKGVAELVVRRKSHDVQEPSLVLIRVSNDGHSDVEENQWIMPMNFTFGGREVMGVEVTDAPDAVRERLLGEPGRKKRDSEYGLSFKKDRLVMPKIALGRKEQFELLVLLAGEGAGVKGEAYIDATGKRGIFERDSGASPRKPAIRALGWSGSTVLSVAGLVFLLLRPASIPAGTSQAATHCVPGAITVYGSTAFAPTAAEIAGSYERSCRSSKVTVNPSGSPIGSIGAVSDLQTSGGSESSVRSANLAMSDGPVSPSDYPNLIPHSVAVIIFSVVVNKVTGIHSLTVDELRGIYSGRYTNWQQLGGTDTPIEIVSRNADSGTRATFDQKILGAKTELPQSSQGCTARDLIPSSPVIRCEKSSTDELLKTVNQLPGAIGYAETAITATDERSKYPQISQVKIGNQAASAKFVLNGEYPFWTIEYFYTYGLPVKGSLLSAFIDYMGTDNAKEILQDRGHIPCGLTSLCG